MRYVFAAMLALLALNTKAAPGDEITLRELQWVDNGFLERQRALVDEIARGEFGTRLRGSKADLSVLQRIMDTGLVNQTEEQKLQALGVALGDVFANELGLEWKVYLDADGKSRATCLKNTKHCLFPVTMIAKRARLGVTPSVQELFDKGESYLAEFQPRLPYSAPK